MYTLKKGQNQIIPFKLAKKLVFVLIFIFVFDYLLFPMPVLANMSVDLADISQEIAENYSEISKIVYKTPENRLPENEDIKIRKTGYYTMTAYNSEVGQTDDSPCITANGFNVCEHGVEDTVAANFLRFGTKVKIPELFGDRVFVVRDRMNERYTDRVDVWMIEKQDAKQFGVKYAKIEVLMD